MQDKNKILDEIFNDDPLGILNVKAKVKAQTADERLTASFQEITDFYKINKKEPEPNMSNIAEYKLYTRLKSLREDGEKMMALEPYDEYKLLRSEPKEINSIDDIFSDDALDLLGGDDLGLYDFKHVPKDTTMPDYIAKRKPCKNFEDFEHLFINCQSDLKERSRQITQFKNEQQIDKGYFFVLKGVLLYVAEIGKRELDKNGKTNARLRVIFENGTESDLLLRSLSAELYKDGRRITEHIDKHLDNFHGISEDDVESGYIYVLKSKSEKEEIKSLQNLYKIGYTTTTSKDRTKNAINEPTYLMAEVEEVSLYKTYNMTTQKLELLLHKFFGNVCLDIDIYDQKGKRHTPREWFVVPLHIIDQTISLIDSGEIVNYIYDQKTEMIKLKQNS